MAGHRIGGTAGLSDSGPSNYHLPYAVFHGINNPPTSFISLLLFLTWVVHNPLSCSNQERSAFDFGELEEAIVLQGVRFKNDEASKSSLFAATRPAAAATLEMFPSWPPLRFHQTPTTGLFVGGGGGACGSISSGAAIFDMEYARWLDDDHRHMVELRTGLQAHLSDSNLRVVVDGYMAHYDEIFQLKGVAAKSDVFHLITGMWTTPAERCFLWMGGFRPSDLIKMLMTQLDPLTEQQVMGIYSLQQSSQQAEEALSQGLEQLQQSLVDTIAGGSVSDGMHHMAVALGKITNLEGFVRQVNMSRKYQYLTKKYRFIFYFSDPRYSFFSKSHSLGLTFDRSMHSFEFHADNLRQQTLHQLCRILTVRQATRCFLVIGEYYGRLRALSSLWASRPRE
ncbi:hypothetical protein C3L33_04720, partial [Rhododendron williamsianum]